MPVKNLERIITYDQPAWKRRLEAAAKITGERPTAFVRRAVREAVVQAEKVPSAQR